MFLGEFERTIDARGRMALAPSFHTLSGDGLILTRGFDRCVQVFTRTTWHDLAQRVNHLPLGSDEARSLRRLLFSGAVEVEVDEQGTIAIPQNLRDYSDLSERVVLAGLHTHFELWNYESWHTILEKMKEQHATMSEEAENDKTNI